MVKYWKNKNKIKSTKSADPHMRKIIWIWFQITVFFCKWIFFAYFKNILRTSIHIPSPYFAFQAPIIIYTLVQRLVMATLAGGGPVIDTPQSTRNRHTCVPNNKKKSQSNPYEHHQQQWKKQTNNRKNLAEKHSIFLPRSQIECDWELMSVGVFCSCFFSALVVLVCKTTCNRHKAQRVSEINFHQKLLTQQQQQQRHNTTNTEQRKRMLFQQQTPARKRNSIKGNYLFVSMCV